MRETGSCLADPYPDGDATLLQDLRASGRSRLSARAAAHRLLHAWPATRRPARPSDLLSLFDRQAWSGIMRPSRAAVDGGVGVDDTHPSRTSCRSAPTSGG